VGNGSEKEDLPSTNLQFDGPALPFWRWSVAYNSAAKFALADVVSEAENQTLAAQKTFLMATSAEHLQCIGLANLVADRAERMRSNTEDGINMPAIHSTQSRLVGAWAADFIASGGFDQEDPGNEGWEPADFTQRLQLIHYKALANFAGPNPPLIHESRCELTGPLGSLLPNSFQTGIAVDITANHRAKLLHLDPLLFEAVTETRTALQSLVAHSQKLLQAKTDAGRLVRNIVWLGQKTPEPPPLDNEMVAAWRSSILVGSGWAKIAPMLPSTEDFNASTASSSTSIRMVPTAASAAAAVEGTGKSQQTYSNIAKMATQAKSPPPPSAGLIAGLTIKLPAVSHTPIATAPPKPKQRAPWAKPTPKQHAPWAEPGQTSRPQEQGAQPSPKPVIVLKPKAAAMAPVPAKASAAADENDNIVVFGRSSEKTSSLKRQRGIEFKWSHLFDSQGPHVYGVTFGVAHVGAGPFTISGNLELKRLIQWQLSHNTYINSVMTPDEAAEAVYATLGYESVDDAHDEDCFVVALDCRNFPNPPKNNLIHLGVHPWLLLKHTQHDNFPAFLRHALQQIFSTAADLANKMPRRGGRLYIACYCNQGKHRSATCLHFHDILKPIIMVFEHYHCNCKGSIFHAFIYRWIRQLPFFGLLR
jgi:hypothetical protein